MVLPGRAWNAAVSERKSRENRRRKRMQNPRPGRFLLGQGPMVSFAPAVPPNLARSRARSCALSCAGFGNGGPLRLPYWTFCLSVRPQKPIQPEASRRVPTDPRLSDGLKGRRSFDPCSAHPVYLRFLLGFVLRSIIANPEQVVKAAGRSFSRFRPYRAAISLARSPKIRIPSLSCSSVGVEKLIRNALHG